MIDHVGILVADLARSKRLYTQGLVAIEFGFVMEHEISGAGFGPAGRPIFWIKQGEVHTRTHIAFRVDDKATVDAFHAAFLRAGARDDGPPGFRPEYYDGYYGAFVRDLDGHSIEAVCHGAPRDQT